MSDVQWYLIHSKNRQEHVAELNLRQLGVETFCPRVNEGKWPRSKALAEGEVLFPGYLFIRADMASQYRKITYAHGVLRVVQFGAAPAVVDEEIVNSIKERVHNGLVVLPKASLSSDQNSLQPGQIVRIHKGPLQGLKAIFEQELNGAQRVALLMKTVAFQGHVILDRNCVGLQ